MFSQYEHQSHQASLKRWYLHCVAHFSLMRLPNRCLQRWFDARKMFWGCRRQFLCTVSIFWAPGANQAIHFFGVQMMWHFRGEVYRACILRCMRLVWIRGLCYYLLGWIARFTHFSSECNEFLVHVPHVFLRCFVYFLQVFEFFSLSKQSSSAIFDANSNCLALLMIKRTFLVVKIHKCALNLV